MMGTGSCCCGGCTDCYLQKLDPYNSAIPYVYVIRFTSEGTVHLFDMFTGANPPTPTSRSIYGFNDVDVSTYQSGSNVIRRNFYTLFAGGGDRYLAANITTATKHRFMVRVDNTSPTLPTLVESDFDSLSTAGVIFECNGGVWSMIDSSGTLTPSFLFDGTENWSGAVLAGSYQLPVDNANYRLGDLDLLGCPCAFMDYIYNNAGTSNSLEVTIAGTTHPFANGVYTLPWLSDDAGAISGVRRRFVYQVTGPPFQNVTASVFRQSGGSPAFRISTSMGTGSTAIAYTWMYSCTAGRMIKVSTYGSFETVARSCPDNWGGEISSVVVV